MNLETYKEIAHAIVKLMQPLIEVVIHDLKTNTIVFIEGNLSKRQIGDPSLIDKDSIDEIENQLSQKIYPKINFNGKILKSISIPLKNKGKTVALMCINCDVSIFQEMEKISNLFLNAKDNQPEILFKNDWQERIHIVIHEILKEKGTFLERLSNHQKKEIVLYLYKKGAFSEKNAANYIAQILDMGRATVFNYLREAKNNGNKDF